MNEKMFTPLLVLSLDFLDNDYEYYLREKLMDKNNLYKKSYCIKIQYFNDTYLIDFLQGNNEINIEINDSIFNCILNTDDFETRKFLLESFVSDYVHPHLDDLIDIISIDIDGDNNIHEDIIWQIKEIRKLCLSRFFTSYINSFGENIKFNVVNIYETYNNKFHCYKRDDRRNQYDFGKYLLCLLVHKSLIDFKNLYYLNK